MKKYITIAALLAAGTAVANAGEETVTFSTETETVPSWETFTDFNGALVYSVAGGGSATIAVDQSQKTVSFSADGVYSVFWGTAFYIAVSGVESNEELTISFDVEKSGTAAISYGFVPKTTEADLMSGFVSSATTSLEGDSISVSVKGDSDYVGGGEGSVAPNGVALLAVSLGDGTNGNVTFSNISVSTAPIPEPSAFGLLAGLGALALVASRRRRK